jgi:hypothetical protein
MDGSSSFFARGARRKARLKRRLKRMAVATWAITVLGALAGLPFADAGLGLPLMDRIARLEPQGGIETTESATSMLRFRTTMFKTRPTPEPTRTEQEEQVAPPPPTTIGGIIYSAAAEFGVDGAYLYSVAVCESGLSTGAYNAAGYYGLFQFDEATWAAYGYGSIYDPTAQARTAARLIAAGQTERWPNCA